MTAFLDVVPTAGNLAGSHYELPPLSGNWAEDGSVPDTWAQPEMSSGEWDSSGLMPPFIGGNILSLTCYFVPRYLIAKGYGANRQGILSALADWKQVIKWGGLLTVTNNDAFVINAVTYTSRVMTCKISGNPHEEIDSSWKYGSVQFLLKSGTGRWTYNPGGFLL